MEKSKDIFMHEVELKQDFKQLREKANKIQKVNPKLFKTIPINPDDVLTQEQSKHIAKHTEELCRTDGMSEKIPQCASQRPEEDQVFLESAIKQFERSVFSVEEIQGKLGKSKSQLQRELITEFTAKLNLVKYGTDYQEISELNKIIAEFRSAALSLYTTFADQQDEYMKQQKHNSLDHVIKNSFSKEFDDSPAPSKKVNPHKTKKAAEDVEERGLVSIPSYQYNEAIVVSPALAENVDKNSPEALQNLLKKAYYHLDSMMGSMQVDFIKKFFLPTSIDYMCTILKIRNSDKTDMETKFEMSTAEEHCEYLEYNFGVIFKGFNTDYYQKIETAMRDLQTIKLKSDSSLNLDHFRKGIHEIIEITHHVEQQQSDSPSDVIVDIIDTCQEYALEFLGKNERPLAISGGHDSHIDDL
jgi:hypothetical protein